MLRKNIIRLVTAGFIMLSVPAMAKMPEPGGAVIDETSKGVLGGNHTAPPASGLTTMSFETVDKDSNGQITREEFQAQGMTESLFTTIDTDHDGFLSRAEINAQGPLIKPIQ